MKKVIIIFATLLATVKVMAQTVETAVSGNAMDAKKAPVESVTISLRTAKDSSVFKTTASNQAGKFSFTGIPDGTYFVTIRSVGYEALDSVVFTISENHPTDILDTLILQPAVKSLAAVVISGTTPLIEQMPDRMIVNVAASVTNVGSTALEVLEKSPGVSVDKDGNISLKGKSPVMVMIDGKPSYLSSAELANLLSNMNSNQLNQIEIMTNPSAKYDAGGNAGVINIKTKKSMVKGFNGILMQSFLIQIIVGNAN